MKVIKDFITDENFMNQLYELILFKTPHHFGEVSTVNDIDNIFYFADFNKDESPYKEIYERMMHVLELNPDEYNPQRINANIQHVGMGATSTLHEDTTEFTAILSVTPNNVQGAEFEYWENDDIIQVKQEQGQLIVIPGDLPHRGLPPTNRIPRVTLAFKMDKVDASN